MKKRVLSLILAAALLLSAVPLSVLATEETQGLYDQHTNHTAQCGDPAEADLCAHGNGVGFCELCQLETQIDSLPAYEELGTLEGDAYAEAIAAVQKTQFTYNGLSAEQQAQVGNADTLLALLSALQGQPSTISAAYSGTCGESLSWDLDENGVLTISGTGAMEDYSKQTAP